MEREFVNYNQALKLKALGFDEPCFGYCDLDGLQINTHHWYPENKNSSFPLPHTTNNPKISAPTFSQAFRWFRDTHNLIHEIQIDRTSQPKFCYAILQYEHYGNYEEIRIREWYLYRTYEEAELACLENLIEVVESKSE